MVGGGVMRGQRQNKTRNPLRRRVLLELRDDWRKYIVIFIFLAATIAFVAGMYVANNSMLTELSRAKEKYIREDGHLALSKEADADLIAAIETGNMADIRAYYVDKAHQEIDEKLPEEAEKALTEQVTDEVETAVEAAIRAQVEEQAALFGITGAALEEMVQTALDENYDAAVEEVLPEAIQEALDSEEYLEALNEARTEAYQEAEEEIDKEYAKAVDRYDLEDADFQAVPVKVYETFYKDRDEDYNNDGVRDGEIRVYTTRDDVNLYSILEGSDPKTADEIVIDRMHADNNGIRVGDTISVGQTQFTVVGLVAFVNYSTLYESNTDTMFDALTFDVAMVTEEGYARLSASEVYAYAWRYEEEPEDDRTEKSMSDRFLKALITQTVTHDVEIRDYVPAYANQAIIFAPDDMGSDKAMGGVLLNILIVVLAFIFAITISNTIAREAPVIGTLRASGYTKRELIVHYMTMPVLVTLISAVVGNILGYTLFKNIVVAMYYNSYSLPTYTTIWTADAFVKTTIIPIALMLVVNLIVISRKLQLTPLQFLRRDLKSTKRKKAIRLPNWKFLSRFRLRILFQNVTNYLVLALGILFVMVMLAMAVGMQDTLSWYQGQITDMMIAETQTILLTTEDADGNEITTATPGAEKFSMKSLVKPGDTHDESITVYGVVEDSSYLHFERPLGEGEVYVSKAYQGKFGVKAGDTITLEEKYENQSYTFQIAGIYDYDAAVAIFMGNDAFNQTFDKAPASFTGFFANQEITDIDEKYIATEITKEDLTKVSRQLDHSMGEYMVYFQYLCILLSAVLIYLLTKIIIERNENAISMVKILGYTNREIAALYMVTTTCVVIASEFISVYLGYQVMKVVWDVILSALDGLFPFVLYPSGIVKMFLLVFAGYLLVTLFDFRRIKRVPMDEALKNVE